MDKKNNKMAFLVSGWGLGHATRIWAIIQQIMIEDPTHQITVATWGNSYSFFEAQKHSYNIRLVSIGSYIDGNSTLYAWSTVDYFLKPMKWFKIWVQNSLFLYRFFGRNPHDICIFDSDFHYLSVLFTKTKRISISQTPYVVEHWKKINMRTSFQVKLNYIIFEYCDFVIQKIFNHLIVCPRLDRSKSQSPKIVFVPPIVRNEFMSLNTRAFNSTDTKLAAIGSGSVLVNRMFATIDLYKIDYVYNLNCRYGIDKQGVPAIDKYNTLFTQCGLSTLSEACARGHKLLLYPIAESPEQIINCIVAENLKFGYRVNDHLLQIPLKKEENLDLICWDEYNGAKVAADILRSI